MAKTSFYFGEEGTEVSPDAWSPVARDGVRDCTLAWPCGVAFIGSARPIDGSQTQIERFEAL